MRQYFLSVLCIGMLCGICQAIVTGSGEIEKTIKAISGGILILVSLSPLLDFQDISFQSIPDMVRMESEEAVSDGIQLRQKAISESIKGSLLSYIEGIAIEEKASVSAEVEVIDGKLVSIVLSGENAPNTRRRISGRLSADLKLEEGIIQWNP